MSTDTLSPQMEKLLGLMEPGRVYTPFDLQTRFYDQAQGSFGYVHAGRGRGTGSLRQTFDALERRGKVKRSGHGWELA